MIYIFLFQLLAHCSLVVLFIYGNIYEYIITIAIYFLFSCVGTTVTFHRLLSHRSFVPRLGTEYIGTILAVLGGIGSSIAWVAVHREHHRFVDSERDPHCPLHKGFFSVQCLSMFYKPDIRYVPDLLRNKFHQFVHRNYWGIHILYVIILWLMLGPFSLVYAYLAPACLNWTLGSLVNTLGHYNYNNKEFTASNHWLLGIIMWGEGYHMNHHDDNKSPRFGKAWYELDIGYLIIKYLCSKKFSYPG